MPAIIPIIINAIVTAVIVAVVDVVVDVVIDAVFGSDEIETRDEMQQQAETAARARALLVNKNSNNAGIPLVYGKYRLGGVRVYLETSNGSGSIGNNDADNEYFNMVLSMCEGEMGPIKELYFGDELVWSGTANAGGGTDGVTLSGYTSGTTFYDSLSESGGATIKYFNGSLNQNADSMMSNSVGGGTWTSNHKLTGVAYLSMKIRANAEAYAGGIPVITAVLDGKDIPDVQFISDGQTGTPAVEEGENSNPANVIYDYLTNTIYGKGLDHTTTGSYQAGLDIDIASFKKARTDLIAAYNGGSGSNMFNGTLSTGQKLYENLQRLARSCNGMLTFSGGKYKLIIQNKNETVPSGSTAHIFSEDNILGQVTVNRGKKSTKINKVTAGFTDQSTKYIDNIIVTKNASALAEDNGTVLEASLDHQLTTNAAFVTRMNEYRIAKTRNQTAIVFTASHKALAVECGDIIKVTQTQLGWDNKLFRAVTITLNSDNEVAISAIEYIASIQI